jgi:uncharacterized membrane protein YoaK (UPF0700 family)
VKSLVSGVDGKLPLMLLGLTALTGVVDSVSILALGRVFVANMTGNVVFVGFAVAGAAGFSLAASLVGLAGFMVGAGIGGQLVVRLEKARARLFAVTVSAELALLLLGTVVVGLSSPLSGRERDIVVALLAVAMGMQNAVARHLAVPDLTTTVLTMTLTGIASDLRHRQHGASLLRRLLAVASMFTGALIGATVVVHESSTAALSIATAILVLVVASAWRHVAAPTGQRS